MCTTRACQRGDEAPDALVPVEGVPEFSRFKSLSRPTSGARPIEFQGVFPSLSHRYRFWRPPPLMGIEPRTRTGIEHGTRGGGRSRRVGKADGASVRPSLYASPRPTRTGWPVWGLLKGTGNLHHEALGRGHRLRGAPKRSSSQARVPVASLVPHPPGGSRGVPQRNLFFGQQVHLPQGPCYRANLNTRGRRSLRSSNCLSPQPWLLLPQRR